MSTEVLPDGGVKTTYPDGSSDVNYTNPNTGEVTSVHFNGTGTKDVTWDADNPNGGTLDTGWNAAYSPTTMATLGYSMDPGTPTNISDWKELVKDYGFRWQGWGNERVADSAVGAFNEISQVAAKRTGALGEALGGIANKFADRSMAMFPALSEKAMVETERAASQMAAINNEAFFGSLNRLVPDWQNKLMGPTQRTSELTNDVVDRFAREVLPQGIVTLAKTNQLIGDMSNYLLNGALPQSLSDGVALGVPGAYAGSTARGRGFSARDLGMSSDQLRNAGVQMAGLPSSLTSSFMQKATGVLGFPVQMAQSGAAVLKNFTPEVVDSATMYGNALQAMAAANDIKPATIYQTGAGAYSQGIQSGMDMYGDMLDLATTQMLSYNSDLVNRAGP